MSRLNEEGQHVASQRPMRVKDKRPAAQQITAEQILREAQMHQDPGFRPSKRKIMDKDELELYQAGKRKEYEDRLRRVRDHVAAWLTYARWEESQKEYERASSVFERAMDAIPNDVRIKLAYVEMRMKLGQPQLARTLWDRFVTHLPRVDAFWFKYAYMEEQLGEVANARRVFRRWLSVLPEDHAYLAAIKFEMRYNETDQAREIYEQYVTVHNSTKPWLRFARFEEKAGQIDRARLVYDRAVASLAAIEDLREDVYVAYAKFEERQKEFERARAIYRYALDHLPKELSKHLSQHHIMFERQHGNRETIEDAIISKRREQYEAEVAANPRNYDAWFDYIRLEEAQGDVVRIRNVFERAIAQTPPSLSLQEEVEGEGEHEKRLWKRYIYIWIMYALYEELNAKDAEGEGVERARSVWSMCLKQIPHDRFTFAKIWIMAAHFEIRQNDLDAAKRVFGNSIGMCGAPKEKVFKAYIELLSNVGDFDGCRKVYGRFLECLPHSARSWIDFAKMEASLGEVERCRAIYAHAVQQDEIEGKDQLWQEYINYEISLKEYANVRNLYDQLIEKANHHVKVYIAYAAFEIKVAGEGAGEGDLYARARSIFSSGFNHMKAEGMKEEAVELLKNWLAFEEEEGVKGDVEQVKKLMPRRVARTRVVMNEAGNANTQAYYEYVFEDEEKKTGTLLEAAKLWKTAQDDSDSESDSDSD